MSRLTYKFNEQEQEEHKTKYLKYEYFPIPDYCIEKGNYGRITSDMIYNKLGKLEDLEEELGCPLEVRERAFDNGFYDECSNHYICEHYVPYLKEMHTRGIMNGTFKRFKFSDYKKTWWLKKDKSE